MENELFTKWATNKIDFQQLEITNLKAIIYAQKTTLRIIAQNTTIGVSDDGVVYLRFIMNSNYDQGYEAVVDDLELKNLINKARQMQRRDAEQREGKVKQENESKNQ